MRHYHSLVRLAVLDAVGFVVVVVGVSEWLEQSSSFVCFTDEGLMFPKAMRK